MTTRTFTIEPVGPFSLREAAMFGFGQRMRPAGVGARDGDADTAYDGVFRLAFCVDGSYEQQVGVEVRQAGPPDATSGTVECVVHGDAERLDGLSTVRAQVARMLSLDHDATGFVEVGTRDAVIGRLQRAAPGLRPPLFHSPYEAAVWAVLSARRPGWQMDRVRAALSRSHGRIFELAGVEVAALPTPSTLLALGADGSAVDGIDTARLQRIRGVAHAAADGKLAAADLAAQPVEQALQAVQQINGIGPFYAALVVIRGCGVTDVLPQNEPRALELAGRLYELGHAATPAELEQLADAWRPWRTWCTVLLRAAATRLPGFSE